MEQEAVVFATRSCATEWAGMPVTVRAGEAWAANDPFVKSKPDLFGPPPKVRRVGPAPAPRVERATRAPGEKRGPSSGR